VLTESCYEVIMYGSSI